MDFKNGNVIYVGGFGGIGFGSCKSLLENGVSNLAILDLNDDPVKLQELKEINENANVFYYKIDLTDDTNIENAFAAVHEKLVRFDVVINGSGIMNEQQIERTIQINLTGVINSTLTALRYMDKSNGGNGGMIVNVSSIIGLDTYGAYAVYTGTKYGVNGFTRALADPFYYEKTQVSFITICPSTTETPMLAALRLNPVTTFERRPPLPVLLEASQTADECGRNLVNALKTATNGTVWILRANKIEEYTYKEIQN